MVHTYHIRKVEGSGAPPLAHAIDDKISHVLSQPGVQPHDAPSLGYVSRELEHDTADHLDGPREDDRVAPATWTVVTR